MIYIYIHDNVIFPIFSSSFPHFRLGILRCRVVASVARYEAVPESMASTRSVLVRELCKDFNTADGKILKAAPWVWPRWSRDGDVKYIVLLYIYYVIYI